MSTTPGIELLEAARLESPLSAMQAFRKEMLVDLSPAKEAALAEKVKGMLRARGEHSNMVRWIW